MRALLALMLCSCSLVTETSDLAGGDAAPTSETCDPLDCVSDIEVLTLAELSPCSANTTDKLGCRSRVAAACRAKNPCCYRGGYGPVDFPNASQASVFCLIEPTYAAPFSELTMASGKCLSSAPASRDCDNAAHISSKKRGHSTAFLQSVSGDTVTLIGTEADFATEVPTTWAELTKLDPGCTVATVESQACTTATHRFCLADPDAGNILGYGPITWTATNVTVVCVQ